MSLRSRSNDDQKQSLARQALGPAARAFGEELRPLGTEVGALGVRAARALLRPVGGLVWGFEKVEAWIAEAVAPKIEQIPGECRIEPKLMIAGPTVDAMKYCGSEPHLRDMFASLLATAMDSRSAEKAHPAFVEMVKQLSPDEARILKYVARGYKQFFPIIEVYYTWLMRGGNKDERRWAKRFGPYSLVGFYAGCGRLRAMPTLIGNLTRLEIIELDFPREIEQVLLDELLDDPIISGMRAEQEESAQRHRDGSGFGYRTGYLGLTPLGEQFLDACVREQQPEN